MPNSNLITFNGSTVTPLFDALIQELFSPEPKGIIYGCEVTAPSATTLRVAGGYGIAYGREFQILTQTLSVTLPASGTQNGRAYVKIDLSDTDTPCTVIADTGGALPADTANFNITNGVAYVPLATYTLTYSAITNLTDARNVLESTGAVVEALRESLTDRVDDLDDAVSALSSYDNKPVSGSNKAVKSGGLFTVLGNALQYGLSQCGTVADVLARSEGAGDLTPFVTGASAALTLTLAGVEASSILIGKRMATAESPRVLYLCFATSGTSALAAVGYIRIADNGVVYEKLQNELTYDTTLTASSTNPVTSGGIKTYVDNKVSPKANTASPTLTGTPKAPTAAVGTKTTQIATTAFVANLLQYIDESTAEDYTIGNNGYVQVTGPIIPSGATGRLINIVPISWTSNTGAFWVMPYTSTTDATNLRAYIVGTPGVVIRGLKLRWIYVR